MSTTDVVRITQQPPSADEEQHGKLKNDLLYFRRRGLFKSSVELSQQGRKCTQCCALFGRFYNTGVSCSRCKHKVCRQCRTEVKNPNGSKELEWVCHGCNRTVDLCAVTSKRVYDGLGSKGVAGEKKSHFPIDLLKHSIRRAWTINGPPSRWSARRKSTELRLYRSLPVRHNDFSNIAEEREVETVRKNTSKHSERFLEYEKVVGTDHNLVNICEIDKRPISQNTGRLSPRYDNSERTPIKRNQRFYREDSSDSIKYKRDRLSNIRKAEVHQNFSGSHQDQASSKISLIKPPRIFNKFISPDAKQSTPKHGERKSSIPILFKRSSREFEDIRSPQETPKRSLIPQRYRGSTDDLRRSREDISIPSLIPKLLSPRNKEDRLKRQDSKDDIRFGAKVHRKDQKEDSKLLPLQQHAKDVVVDSKNVTRNTRRDSKEDVGRDGKNLNTNVSSALKGKQVCKEEKQEKKEQHANDAWKSKLSEQSKLTLMTTESKSSASDDKIARSWMTVNEEKEKLDIEKKKDMFDVIDACVYTMEHDMGKNEKKLEIDDAKAVTSESNDLVNEFDDPSKNPTDNFLKDCMKTLDNDSDGPNVDGNESKTDVGQGKRLEEYQVIRRKFSKEEFSNPDDTDETPNKRCSSHLSPEASPLSTRSSRYSPRESESEPTPALPRKTAGDSSSASQRIRDAITRTRRESTSSARYESSGSESVRPNDPKLHGYVELARKVKFFSGNSSAALALARNDEVIQRDSATSAGEDEPHDENHIRAGPVSSQGRTMLRRRRQFDAQGSRRRGRSHARNYCGEELSGLPTLDVIGRDERQQSPTGQQGQEQPLVDYRRLVFISSDSSSGREEDDADSSCSSSSYLNGLPRGHAQSLEDCDWDYFESGSLPLPAGVPVAIGATSVATEPLAPQDWSCCLGRGASACQACGGSQSANVLPVPVPIPVPVPYPVPVPASLWTGDFAAVASSMISRAGETHTDAGVLRLRGDPAAPWFAWHPRFNQPLHGSRFDPRLVGVFDPGTCTFRPSDEHPTASRLYQQGAGTAAADPLKSEHFRFPPETARTAHQRESAAAVAKSVDEEPTTTTTATISSSSSREKSASQFGDSEERETGEGRRVEQEVPGEEPREETGKGEGKSREEAEGELLSSAFDDQMMYQHVRENSGSSSGRSSADSSDLEDDSASHRFSRVFVVNDDSLTSDNEIEDNEDEAEDSDSVAEGGVTLKRVTALSEDGEPVIFERVNFLKEDSSERTLNREGSGGISTEVSPDMLGVSPEKSSTLLRSTDLKTSTSRKLRSGPRVANLLPDVEAAEVCGSSESRVKLKSIRPIDPDLLFELASSGASSRCPPAEQKGKATRESSPKGRCSDPVAEERISVDAAKTEEEPHSRPQPGSGLLVELQSDSSVVPDSLEPASIDGSGDLAINREKSTRAITAMSRERCETQTDKRLSDTSNESLRDGSTDKDIDEKIPSCDATATGTTLTLTTDSASSVGLVTGSETLESPRDLDGVAAEVDGHREDAARVSKRSSWESERKSINRAVLLESLAVTHGPVEGESSGGEEVSAGKSSTSGVGRRQEVEKLNDSWLPSSTSSSSSSSSSSSKNKENVGNDRDKVLLVGTAHDGSSVRGEGPGSGQVVGDIGEGNRDGSVGNCASGGEADEETPEGGTTRFRSVERRPSTGKENGYPSGAFSTKESCTDAQPHFPSVVASINNSSSSSSINNNNNNNNNNRYRSLVMITQEASYQPVSVITSDTTTLLQPDEVRTTGQGLAGYFQLALEAVTEQPQRKMGQAPRRPLMVKRHGGSGSSGGVCGAGGVGSGGGGVPATTTTTTTTSTAGPGHRDAEVDSGNSVESNSENEEVPVRSGLKVVGARQEFQDIQEIRDDHVQRERLAGPEQREGSRVRASSQSSSDDNSCTAGVVILEEGLADDDSWVEEVSHDEEDQGATTATEESSEDEANNLGDREEELRGYHRQAIDFTLHTIVEESCEESEAEPSPATGSPSKKPRPPSASELEKYFFFGLGGEGNSSSLGSREVDSLSETSSIYSEGLESLGQDEANTSNGQTMDKSNSGEGFLNSSRLEKYFLSEFLGFDQDRRDSDGSVGSDSEGRPSPEAQRRKRLVRARGTGRSHSSSLDNLLALAQSSQNLSSQNSLQDLTLNQDSQDTLSEGSSTETDLAEDGQVPVFGTDGQFDTVKRKKKKPRNLGTQSPRVPEDRNKTPEPIRELVLVGEAEIDAEGEVMNSEDSERAKTPQLEVSLGPTAAGGGVVGGASASSPNLQNESARSVLSNSGEYLTSGQRSKHQSRDSGFVGSCDDLLQHQKSPEDTQAPSEPGRENPKERSRVDSNGNALSTVSTGATNERSNSTKIDHTLGHASMPHLANPSLSRKDSFNNWSSDEETNLMMSKMRQFFKTMVANSNGQNVPNAAANSSGTSPAPSPRLAGYASKNRLCAQNRTKPPQLVYFENELTRLMKTVPGIRDEQVREIVEYLSSEDTWSDSYDSSDYTSSDLEGTAGGRRSALQEQISQSCQQIISKFDTTSDDVLLEKDRDEKTGSLPMQGPCFGRDTAFVYQKLVQSFTKMAGDGVSSDTSSTPHSSPPLIAKVMHHIGSRLVALMHEVSEGGPTVQHHSTSWRRYSQHHRTPSSASTTEDDDSTSDSTNPTSSTHLQLPRSKSHDPLLLINSHPVASNGQEGEEREASDYERFSWRGSFESALMAADSRTKLSLLACSSDVSSGISPSALAMAAKRRSAGDLLFNPKSFSREQLDRVRSCGSIGGGGGGTNATNCGGSIEERIWSNRRRSSVPDANTRGESGASAGDEDTEDELEYGGESRATTLPRGMQSAITAATNSLPRLSASAAPSSLTSSLATSTSTMHKAHSVYHFLPQHSGVKSARYRPPGFARNSNVGGGMGVAGPKRAVSAPGLQISASQSSAGKRDVSRSRRQQAMSLTADDGSSLSEACNTPIIGAGSRTGSSHTVMDMDDMDPGLHSDHMATRASLSSLGARSDSMASVYSGAGEGRCCRSVAVTGEVEFSMQYDYKHLTFEVHVTKCKNLAPVDTKRKRSDPYVKVYLLPDKSKSGKRKTKVKKHTLNPEFNETLKFHMSLSGLETRTLWLTVWHSDMFGRNDFLGEVRIPLENKIFDDPTPHWYPLQERTEPFDDPVAYKGEVIVGLKFVPPDPAQQEQEREMNSDRNAKARKNWSRGALHVLVKEARYLQTRAKNSGTCDPFCKSYLLPDKGRSGKQKTGVIRRCGGSPVWGHTFIYKDVSLQELAERGLELTVWDHDRIASNEFLGGVRFNLGTGKHYGKPVDWMDATGRELSLWQSMLERPNFWVEGAVTLRPNLHNHGKTSNS